MGIDIRNSLQLLGSSARSPDRESTLQTKVRTLEHELHNRNCTIVRTKCSPPVQRWVGGGIYTLTLLHLSRNAPPVPTKVKRLQYGYLVISLGWTVRLGYSYPDHVFFALREPSVAVFDKLRVASPSSFATLESPATPEGSCHNLRECGPPGSVMFDYL